MVNINIYILDRNLNICNTLSSNGDVNSSPFFNDVYKQVLETGVETFEFESMQLDYLENCNYVAFEYKGDLKLFQISEIEDTHEDNLVKRVYCEMAGIELTYEIIRPRMIQSANIRQFLEILLSDTSWNVGYIDEDITDVFTIEISDFEKIYDVIQENIKLFECEIVFRVEKENGIFKKYIDAYKSRGDITNYRFEYSKNIQGISRTVNSFELVTALIGVGKDDLTFKSCEWSKSNGDPIDKPKGQDYIVDESAFRLYNNNGSHLMGYYKCDLDTPYDLLNATYKELKERNTPKVDYEVDITLIDDEANIGDTVYVIDNDWQPTPLHLSARISQLEISFTDKTKNKCTLSNYNRVKSKIKDDLNEILNRIPEDTSFMGISKGGLLSSSIEANGYRLQIKNKLTDKNGKEYFFRLKDKTSTSFMNNILTKDPKYVTQSFAIDFDESCIYTTQSITETDPHHILITKMNFTGDILGYMRLHGFGHGSQIGIDKIDGVTKIWCECEGRPHTDTGRLYGTKICRFEFVDGAEYTNSTGSVYDIIPNARNIQVAISEETNRLSVKYITYDNKNGFKVFDLRSVLNNRPRVLASFLIPNWLEDSINPNQGHSVYENRIYHYQGGDSQSAEARITVLDFRGNVLDSNIIKDGIGFTNREPEGLYLRCNNGIYELYAGISEGAWPNRKYHIYKYYEGLGSEYEKRGTFIHNNGHSTDIYETIIDTNLDGTARRKEYLIYSSNKTSQFIIGSFKNGSWWVNNELYTPEVNDAIIAELIESDNAMEIILLTNDFESIKGENGQDGSPGQDAVFLELTNEFHSVPTDADGNGGIYAGCETELRLYKGDVQLTDNISYSIKNTSNITGKLDGDKYTVTNLTKDTGYVDLVATYFGKEYIKRFSLSKNKQGLGGEDGLTPTVYWLMTSTSTISKDSKGNLKPSSVTFWAKSQTGEDSVVNYQGIFKIYESIDGNIFTLKHTSELDDTVPYTPSSTAQSIKCELYLNDGVTLIDQDIVNIVKDGTDGFSGADAKYVLLTGEQIFKYTNNFTGTPTPSSITLTGTPFNISSSNAKWYYKKSSDTNYTLISANNGKMEFTLNHNDSTLFANNNKVVTIKFDIDGYYDEMTIAKISDGSSGSDGEDGYFVLLTNENHTVPCENDGTVVNGELEKAKTEIHVFKGTQEVSFSLSKTDVGCTSTYDSSTKTLSITSLTSKAATVTMQITVNGTVFTKVMTISKATKGDTGEDSYTVDMTNDNYSFNCDAKGNIASVITTTTVITAFKGVNPVVPTIGTLPTVAGLTLSKSNGIITIKANTGTSLADNGSFDIPVTVGGNNFIKTFSWTKVKNGSNGSNGVSVTSTDVEYAQNTSSTTAPTTGWTTTAPTWQNGKYIWSRTKTILSNGTTKYTNPACITGQQGNTGATGTGIYSITEEYYLSTSKTTQTGGSWVTTPPTWSTGKYMWTRSKRVYKNPTSTEYTTPVCDSSWEVVNEIEIGGRNFVRYSDKFRAVAGSTGITSTLNSDGSLTVVAASGNGNWFTSWYDENFNSHSILDHNFKEGDTFTVSFTMKSSNSTAIPSIYIKPGMGYYPMKGKLSTEYSTVYYTGVWRNADTIKPHLGFASAIGSYTIKNWKIEKGNKPTDWTPAPEDVDNAIGENIKSVDVMYYLSTSQTSLAGGSWQTTAPQWVNGKYMWSKTVTTLANGTVKESSPTCIAGAKGDKGDAGTNGTNGVNGISPVLVTITGQQSMKYLDKTTAPTPSTITLTANVMEGNVVVSSGMTYIWQYKNSSGTWVNLSGTYTSKTYSLAHNNTGFVNEVAQIRVAVSYKSKTYYLEHTVTKIYDNKYISKQEVFDKITEGGTNQLIYKDPSTGEIYINATFIKTGQLVADLIKGGILTLGGTGNSDTGDYGRFRILDSTGQNELASMDGGEMRMVNLQAEELNATDLNVKNINCATYAPAIYEYTKVYVNTTSGNDEVEFESGAVFKTLQGALDSAPKNLNGFTTEIVLQTAVSENIVIRGFSGGTLNILMNSKNINGYVVARDCSAQVFILGGLTTTDIPDGINNTGLRPNIQPSQLFSFGGYNYSFVAIGCPFVYVRSVDIFGKTGTTTNYCGGSVNGSNVYVQNVNAYASNSGWNVTTGGKMTTKETYGRCERLAYNVQLGGVAHICNGNSTGAPSNIYTGNGGQVIQGNVTFVGSGDVGSNNNTTTNNTSIVLNANYGDSYKVKYSSWRKDNSVRQGDWSSTGMNKGCWFFGNQFADLKGKTIKSVKLTLQRQSGGNSGAVAFTLKMHNHTGRPSGAPSYLSGWSKNVSLSVGQSTTITITDSAVLTAIKNGTMKGFGIEASSTSNSYYGILTPKLKAVVTY